MPTKNKMPQSSALKYLHERYVGDDPQRLASLEEERTNLDVAQQIHDLRTAAGLSMRELALKVGTSASAIARLENADYEGHSLSVLRRVAAALNQRVEIRFSRRNSWQPTNAELTPVPKSRGSLKSSGSISSPQVARASHVVLGLMIVPPVVLRGGSSGSNSTGPNETSTT